MLFRENSSERLGYRGEGWPEVRRHVWFQELNWDALQSKSLTPKYIPDVSSTPW